MLFLSFNDITFFLSGRVFFKKKNISLVVIMLAVVLFLCKLHKAKDSSIQMKEQDTWDTVAITENTKAICERNTTAANTTDFGSFPLSMKNFLYYQHCRNFQMLLDSPDKCGGPITSEVFLLLVIKSSPGNFERREALRKTWAEEAEHNGVMIRRVFISGTTGEGFHKIRMNKLLELEQEEYNDILQWDFTESHYNLTLKQVLFLEWFDKKCPHASFVVNGDDDVLARPDNMAHYLQKLQDNNGSRHLFAGYVVDTHPFRTLTSKYFVPVEVYEANQYPPFCSGGGIFMSRHTLSVLYRMSQSIPLFPLDDVYLAILLDKAGLNVTTVAGVRTFAEDVNVETVDPCIYKNDVVVHGYLPTQLYIIWQRIHDPNLNC